MSTIDNEVINNAVTGKTRNLRRVVITGGGIVSSLGDSWDEAFERMKTYKNCIVHMTEWDKYKDMNTRLAGPYTKPLPEFPRKKVRSMGRVALFSLMSANDALKMAGLLNEDGTVIDELHNGRTGIAYGSCMGSIEPLMGFYAMLVNNDVTKIDATTYVRAMPQTCAANLEVYYGISGRMITTNTACTSGAQSIGYAYEAIKYGMQDMMIAGGAEELTPADSACFDTLFSASNKNDTPELTPSAFDKNRDGLVIGEGGGALILEEYEHAVKRGAHIYAEVAGFGTNTDGKHITNPNKETMARAMELALEDSGVDSKLVGYVNAHGTATHAGDIAETKATEQVFGRAVPISTIKNYTGHTLGACGVIEAWLTINMMNNDWFCPNINTHNVDPECGALDYILDEGRKIHTDCVMSNNFAFGGVNTSLLFKRA